MAAVASQKHEITPGQQYSFILHLLLLIVMIFGLPDFLHKKIESEPMAISVDILPIAPVSNVKPVEKVEPPKEIKKPVADKTTDRKAQVEARKEEPKKIEPKPVQKIEKLPPKELAKKPEPKKPEPKPVEKKDDPLNSILKNVADSAKTEESKHPTQAKPQPQREAKSEHYNNSMPLSMSEIDGIKQQLERCWNPPAGAKDVGNLVVNLHVRLNQDGSLISVDLASDSGRYNSDSFFRAAADSAKRAVRECAPLKNLPQEKYEGSKGWSDMELTFDPKDLS